MSRAKFQVLIIPFRMVGNGIPEFAITRRSDMDAWQFLSGGGEVGLLVLRCAPEVGVRGFWLQS